MTRTTEESLEFDYSILQILLMRSRSETALHSMRYTRSRTASERRSINFQNPIEVKTDSEVVENRIINQIFISFFITDARTRNLTQLSDTERMEALGRKIQKNYNKVIQNFCV